MSNGLPAAVRLVAHVSALQRSATAKVEGFCLAASCAVLSYRGDVPGMESCKRAAHAGVAVPSTKL